MAARLLFNQLTHCHPFIEFNGTAFDDRRFNHLESKQNFIIINKTCDIFFRKSQGAKFD